MGGKPTDGVRESLDTAAAHASRSVPVAGPGEPVDGVLAAMRGHRYDSAAVVAVLDGDRLVGLAPIEKLIAAGPGLTMAEVMDPAPPVVAPGTDQEQVALTALQRDELGLAVVDEQGRFTGLIPPQRLQRILLEEHEEDLARFGGFLAGADRARRVTEEKLGRRLWHRMPWLTIGLAGAITSAGLVSIMEDSISANVAVVYFIPGIVYLADAVGTQTETLTIRGLSLGVAINRIAAREATTGLLVGLLLAALMFPVIGLWWSDWALAVAVSLAVLCASTIATLVAMALPWLLQRVGVDPAFGAGPLATVIQDLLSIAIYLVVVTLLL